MLCVKILQDRSRIHDDCNSESGAPLPEFKGFMDGTKLSITLPVRTSDN